MAVDDLWVSRDGSRTDRYGRGLRFRVRVKGWPSTACRTRAEAELLNAQRLVAVAPSVDAGRRVGDFVKLYLEAKSGLSKGGRDALQAGAGHVLARWAGVRVGEVRRHEVEAWLAGLRVGRHDERLASAETKIKALQVLRGGLNVAVELGVLAANPVLGVRVVRRNVRDPQFLSVGELARLAEAAGGWSGMVWLMGTCGSRISETIDLRVGDVDVSRGRLRVRRSKSGRARDVPVPASVLGMLDLDRPASAPLFERPGRPLSADYWRRWVFAPAVASAGLEAGLKPHDLRHTAASLMIQSGATVKDVQMALGHASAKMTLDVYGHWFDHGLDDISRRLDAQIVSWVG